MTTLTQELIDRTMQLSPDDRKELVHRLLESLDPTDDERAAWREEQKRRAERVAAGNYTALTLEQVNAEVLRAVEEARKK